MKTKLDRLNILKSKFERHLKTIKEPNWEFTGQSILIHSTEGNIELYPDHLVYKNKTILLTQIKSIHWLGKNRPTHVSIQKQNEFKKSNFDTVGITLNNNEYIEFKKLNQSYADFMSYIKWSQEYGGLSNN